MSSNRQTLQDLKVLDFMWVMAGPAATRTLADFGATVVRIESAQRPDPARAVGPHVKDEPGADTSMLWNNNNAGKLGLSLDLSSEAAVEVVHDLVRWADVVCESFAPGTLSRLGFGYESLKEVNSRIVMMSTCLLGQYGPHAGLAGFGNLSAAVTGFYGLCGWPDRPPAGPFGAYTDYIAPRYIAAAILAAIAHRDESGEGNYIDLAQAEAALHFLAPALLDCAINGHVAEPCGNKDPHFAPHGVYPCLEENTWVAIACRSDDHWSALCGAMGKQDLLADARFDGLSGRKEHEELLDQYLLRWTRKLKAADVEETLQRHGVPCSVVQNSRECAADAQLMHRNHFCSVSHPAAGELVIEGPRFHLSGTAGAALEAAPLVGQHSHLVLREMLGYGDEKIDQLMATGAIA